MKKEHKGKLISLLFYPRERLGLYGYHICSKICTLYIPVFKQINTIYVQEFFEIHTLYIQNLSK